MFNEVFLDDVFVPDDCVVGEVDDGWKLARTTLANERVAMAGSHGSAKSTERAVDCWPPATLPSQRRSRSGTPSRWRRCARCSAPGRRCARWPARVPVRSRAWPSCVGVRNRQDGAELVVELLGDARVHRRRPGARGVCTSMLITRCLSIAGGTTQVLRNVAGERILGTASRLTL